MQNAIHAALEFATSHMPVCKNKKMNQSTLVCFDAGRLYKRSQMLAIIPKESHPPRGAGFK